MAGELNMGPNMFSVPLRLLALVLLSMPVTAWTATTINVKVTVVAAPSCVINDNRTIDVDFGTVVGPRVDGVLYERSVEYTLECTNPQSNAMKIMIKGNPTTFDSSALQTNITDFGISLQANGSKLNVNDWLMFTYPNKPVLKAVPVKRSGSTPVGGDFQASATMMIAYQ